MKGKISKLTAFAALTALLSLLFSSENGAGQQGYSLPSQIQNEINAILSSEMLNGAVFGIEVREPGSNTVLYARDAERLLIPASNMKIITASAALDILKPEYTFKTEVYVDGLRNGIVEGNIYLKGYGDPLLTDENLWTIARDTAYRGVNKISGKVIGDDSYFDAERYGKGWGDIGPEAYNAPIGALSLNFNTFVVTVVPAGAAGAPPKVFLMPPDRHLEITNRAVTTASGSARIKVVEVPNKVNAYEVIGQVPLGKEVTEVRRTVGDPGLYTAGSFEAYLMSWGVSVSGEIARGTVPSNARLLFTYKSPPLYQAVQAMGKFSNNFVSEQILKTIGAETAGAGGPKIGTAEGGIKAVEGYLSKLGVPQNAYVIADGSGLSRKNRLSPRAINTVLVHVYKNPHYFPEFLASLSIGGVDGTVGERFKENNLRRMFRAKTGHLNGVNALSGYLQTDSGAILVFSMIFNNFSCTHSAVERIEEKILLALRRY